MHSLLSLRSHPSAHPSTVTTPVGVAAVPTIKRHRYYDAQVTDASCHARMRHVRREQMDALLLAPTEGAATAAVKNRLALFAGVMSATFVADGVVGAGGAARDFLLGIAAPHETVAVPAPRSRWWRWQPRAAAAAAPPPVEAPAPLSMWAQIDGGLVRLVLLPHEVGQALCAAVLTGVVLTVTVPVSCSAGAVVAGATRLALRHQSDEQARERQEQLQMLLSLERRFGRVVHTSEWLAQLEPQASGASSPPAA